MKVLACILFLFLIPEGLWAIKPIKDSGLATLSFETGMNMDYPIESTFNQSCGDKWDCEDGSCITPDNVPDNMIDLISIKAGTGNDSPVYTFHTSYSPDSTLPGLDTTDSEFLIGSRDGILAQEKPHEVNVQEVADEAVQNLKDRQAEEAKAQPRVLSYHEIMLLRNLMMKNNK